MEHLLQELNEPQREAVAHTDGPLLILAGPGSGKTRVVTRRAAHLAATVTRAYKILAITFTNKAATEMRERIDSLGVAPGMTVCTFHALCAKLLRIHHDRVGVPANFTIFDRDDRRKIIKQAIADSDLSTTNWQPSAIESAIGDAKNHMVSAAEFAEQASDWRERTIARVYTQYEAILTKMGGLDFDDLLMRMAVVLSRDSQLCMDLEDRFSYVLIDEYQDTNDAQYLIAKQLTQQRKNLCATGDPDQSIYGWRGANIENILAFEKDYPNAKVVRLEQNYRSTKRVLSAASALIAGNSQRKEKSLWTENADGARIRVVEYENGDEEAALVVRDLAQRIREGQDASSVAVFYRVNSLSRSLEEAFLREGLPYQIARGVEFYNRKEIRDVLAYMRVVVNPADDVALLRIINTPTRGIGNTTVNRLKDFAKGTQQSILEVVNTRSAEDLGRSAKKLKTFAELMQRLAPLFELPPAKALDTILRESGLRAMYAQNIDLDDAPAGNLDELLSAASVYQEDFPEATLIDWLEHTALVSDVDAVEDGRAAVTLMTLHAAKGLEFDVVYVIGWEEGLLPFRRRDQIESSDVEEERRLAFVGMTRARKRLTLSYVRYRMMRGITERSVRSPFLDELPYNEVEWPTKAPTRANKRQIPSGELPHDIEEWHMGSLVRHPIHGLGQVMEITKGARRTHVDVQFKNGSRRSWVLEFADLERVDFDEVGDAR